MSIALELYLEGIPSGELELEMVRRAYSRTEIQIGLLALTLERMRAKQAARQAEIARQQVRIEQQKREGKLTHE